MKLGPQAVLPFPGLGTGLGASDGCGQLPGLVLLSPQTHCMSAVFLPTHHHDDGI